MNLRHGLVVLLLPLSALFFVGGPSETALPTLRHLWNFGHVIAFALATLTFHLIFALNSRKRVLVFLLLVIGASFFIESAQLLVGRDFSLLDILRNLVGCCLILFFVARKQTPLPFIVLAAGVLMWELSGLSLKAYQDIVSQTRAPVIADFENRLIVQRWQGQISQSELYRRQGNYSAKVDFAVGKYPGINFWPVLRNWQGYEQFSFEVFNPTQQSEKIVLRIDDIDHALSPDNAHNNRYNQAFTLQPGWNTIRVALTDIENAPVNRTLNLSQVHQILLFMVDVKQEKTLYFDDLRLN